MAPSFQAAGAKEIFLEIAHLPIAATPQNRANPGRCGVIVFY
jgi:hypothetical protein